MSMNISDAQSFLDREREAENYAIPFVHGLNFTDCLRINKKESELEVELPDQGKKKIQAHRIYGLWKTYLIATGNVTGETVTIKTKGGKVKQEPVAKEPDVFTGVADNHIKHMFDWITTNYTDVYKSITTNEERNWLEMVIRFTVYRRILECKYNQWLMTRKGFADQKVAIKVAEIYRFKHEIPVVARLINTILLKHKGRDAEDWEKSLATDLITGIVDTLRSERLRLLPPISPDEIKLIGDHELEEDGNE